MLLLLVGILLRLFLMPFFTHVDFLSEMRRVHEIILSGYSFPATARLVVFFIETLFMKLSLPILPDAETMFFVSKGEQATAGLNAFSLFISDPYIFRTLLLLKMPYLFFDIGTAVVLFGLLKGNKNQIMAVSIWLFNPITLYAFYIFGRFESIAIFFLAMTMYMLHRQRLFWAAAMLGMAINSRITYILLLPFFVLSLYDTTKNWFINYQRILLPSLLLSLLAIFPFMIKTLLSLQPLFPGKDPFVAGQFGRFWGLQLQWLSLFIAGYAILCLWIIEAQGKDSLYKFMLASGSCLALFLIFCTPSAHFTSWLVIFPICMYYFQRHVIFAFFLLSCCWCSFWLFNTDDGVFTMFLASPVHKSLFTIKTIPQLYEMYSIPRGLPKLEFIRWFFQTLLAVSLGYVIYKMAKGPAYVDKG